MDLDKTMIDMNTPTVPTGARSAYGTYLSAIFRVHLRLILLLTLGAVASAQVRPVNDYGALGLGQLLKRLQTTGSVMMIGAHPDDEDSALLAYLARGENA